MHMCSGKKVSVIVPVYQKEDYIDRAVISLLQQTYPRIEILLIDDGSNDGSYSKCKKWERENANIQVFHHDNRGVSYARNVGIKKASGDYIMFMDSDDTLVWTAVERMVSGLEESQADVCMCGYSKEIKGGMINYIPNASGVFSKLQFVEYNFRELYKKNILHNIGTKIYRKDILNEAGIYFAEGHTVLEDISFCLMYIKVIQKICIINDSLYTYYCDDKKSVNHNYRKDFWNNVFELNKSIEEIIGETELYYTIMIRNIHEAFLNELLVDQFDNNMIRKKIYNVCHNENIIKSKGKARLSELTLEECFFTILLWQKRCWLIDIMLLVKRMRKKVK